MAIQFASVEPAINLFNANVARGDQARRLEEQDFRQRFQLEQAMGADRGTRQAILAEIAARRAAGASPQTAPPIAQVRAAPQSQPIASALPAPLPAQTEPSPFGEDPKLSAAVSAPGSPVAAPPTISSINAQPAQSPMPQRKSAMGSSDVLMETMAKTPGTSKDLLHMYAADQSNRRAAAVEERKATFEAEKLVWEHFKNGDIGAAQAVNQKYGLNMPQEVFTNRRAAAAMQVGAKSADHALGTKGTPEQRLTYMMTFAQNWQPGNEQKAHQLASAAALKVPTPPASGGQPHYYTAADNSVQAVGPDLVARPVQGPRARPPQPPFNLTAAAGDVRNQGLRDKAIDNAMREAGNRWNRMAPDEKQRRIDYHLEFLTSGKPSTPPPGRPGAAAPGAAAPNNDPLGLRAR